MVDNRGTRFRLHWRLILLGLIIVAMITFSYQLMNHYVTQQSLTIEQQRTAGMEWVLVFSSDVDAGHEIGLADLQQRKFPPDYISDDWLRPQDAMAVIGQRVQHFVSAGEPVLLTYLQAATEKSFSDVLNHGEYAVTTTVGIEQIHHGLVSIGNRVSLVSTNTEPSSTTVLANIEVLALDQKTRTGPDASLAVTMTFRFNAQQALAFEHLRQGGFTVWLQHPEGDYAAIRLAVKPKVYLLPRTRS